ncbi:ugp2 protein [Capsaspora owczarzaki ATCC 30864]|uniref:UTP--glucose-1-phosphate uridylyltransferase n=1 Tax=Capsaspora owczarzaki (strain ATCC 30864) TaxID=595528 RepID=A0A0D2WWZ1_CAPO3|nr:ugp2 protein [Capsaspora owczarzaki ATCC 30864]KJE97183.1 ugp2 protein [Capsaspora owczarzaki ATCC 30864]|eukprot:XP_004343505.2 ugp2 protein [Capsaspora owczarzaki ATCC 30864]
MLQEATVQLDSFKGLFRRFLQEGAQTIQWDKIKPPAANMARSIVLPYASLDKPNDHDIKGLLDQLVVIKLNGGLGTTMGCVGPKSVIDVRDDMTFLDMTVRQIEYLNNRYHTNVPLILMNSFNTHEETDHVIQKYHGSTVTILTFNQSKFPRISKDTLLPVAKNYLDHEAWYPPGHGDIYESLVAAPFFESLLLQGRQYAFISNVDNLGATVDTSILNYLINQAPKCEFLMEVTDKTRADIKGGTLIDYEGKTRLLEIAQVPKQHIDDFKSVTKFRIFNTNNLWIKMSAIKKVVTNKELELEIIVNHKNMESGVNVIQLETAVGSAMKHFENAIGINVPRSRFLPVKNTSDLFLVKSNLYHQEKGTLVMNPKRLFEVPLVKLGDEFRVVSKFLARFATIPDILELDHLTVTGDVTFGRHVSLKGTVIMCHHGDRIDIPVGAVLENKIVSGNLRILDH